MSYLFAGDAASFGDVVQSSLICLLFPAWCTENSAEMKLVSFLTHWSMHPARAINKRIKRQASIKPILVKGADHFHGEMLTRSITSNFINSLMTIHVLFTWHVLGIKCSPNNTCLHKLTKSDNKSKLMIADPACYKQDSLASMYSDQLLLTFHRPKTMPLAPVTLTCLLNL